MGQTQDSCHKLAKVLFSMTSEGIFHIFNAGLTQGEFGNFACDNHHHCSLTLLFSRGTSCRDEEDSKNAKLPPHCKQDPAWSSGVSREQIADSSMLGTGRYFRTHHRCSSHSSKQAPSVSISNPHSATRGNTYMLELLT